jgi:succinoglycan biosynthesis transport protein ExoP
MSESLVPAHSQATAAQLAADGAYGGNEYLAPPPAKNPLERPVAALRRYKWLIVGIGLVATTLGVVGSRFIKPKYDARATLWLAANEQSQLDNGPIRADELLNALSWIELFKSFRIVDEVVLKLGLYLRPAEKAEVPLFSRFALADRFVPGRYQVNIDREKKRWILKAKLKGIAALVNRGGIVVDSGVVGDSVGRKAGLLWNLPDSVFQGKGERQIEFVVATPRETSGKLLDNLRTRMVPGSNFLWLGLQGDDPKVAAKTMNAWVEQFGLVAADLKKRNLTEFAKILQGQLEYAEQATLKAESAYQNFRVNAITLPTDAVPIAPGAAAGMTAGDPALASFFNKKIEYDNLRQDREALEKSLTNASATGSRYEGLLLIPSVAMSPGAEALRAAFSNQYQLQAQLSVLRQSYTDEHPVVKDLIGNLNVLQKETIPQLANQLLVQLKEREAEFQRRIASASKELEQIPPRTIEERRLSRAFMVSEGLYTNLKNRYAEAQLAEASAIPDVTVLDTAVAPSVPTVNTAPRIILMVAAGGFAAAIALALLLDLMDKRIRYTDQVVSELRLPIAGAVPRIPKGGINASSPEQVVQFVESFRSLRMHIMYSTPGQRIAIAVTSAAPGDGKSLVSTNLALSFAEAGLRTVLVDGDTRRGSLHKMFGMKVAGGLTDYLAGTNDLGQVVRPTTHANLSFMSCGRRHPRSPELIASLQLKKLVHELSQSFDVVIFDTPPLAAGIDGFAISAAAGSILMVLRMDETERRLVAAKLSVLDRLPVEVVGAVLNGVPLTGEFQYYAYSKGYSLDNPEPAGELVASR